MLQTPLIHCVIIVSLTCIVLLYLVIEVVVLVVFDSRLLAEKCALILVARRTLDRVGDVVDFIAA